jgi:hypothetical protein
LRFRNAREHEKLENTPEQEVDALAE